jgi:hypothetical protein
MLARASSRGALRNNNASCSLNLSRGRHQSMSRRPTRVKYSNEQDGEEDEPEYVRDENRTPYYTQTSQKFMDLITIQALKNVLHYLQETNGEMHMFLHQYVTENPFELGADRSMDDWLTQLAAQPMVRVKDPRRSSIPGPAAEEAALRGGREVSPRDLCERILAVRKSVGEELVGVVGELEVRNRSIFTRALTKSFQLSDDDVA